MPAVEQQPFKNLSKLYKTNKIQFQHWCILQMPNKVAQVSAKKLNTEHFSLVPFVAAAGYKNKQVKNNLQLKAILRPEALNTISISVISYTDKDLHRKSL